MRDPFILSGVAGAFATLAHPLVARACSVCVSGSGNDPVADAFNWSVLFLMATPYTTVGSIAGWIFFRYRRAASKHQPKNTSRARFYAWPGRIRRVEDE
ncbi:MAG: hypothetical protein HY695_37155 [Deltaproteobacteria bacterium]|nr:hypothetical protein [Deltaproteobacteria bacterium]